MKAIPRRSRVGMWQLDKMIDHINKHSDVSKLTLLEVGSWAGDSAYVFAKRFKFVVCVDPWKPSKCQWSIDYDVKLAEIEFDKLLTICSNIAKTKCRIEEISHIFGDKSIDVVYIDGEHDYKSVKRDIECMLPKCKSFICGHDYYDNFPDLIKAVDEIKKPDMIFEDTSWLIKL